MDMKCKIQRSKYLFYKIRSKLTLDVLRMIYFAFDYLLLLYGIEVYANNTATHLTTRTLNKLLLILQQKPTRTHY